MQAVEEELEIQSYSGVNSRHFEYPFGISELLALRKKVNIEEVLDAGSYGSHFGLILASLGFKVTGIDLTPWDIEFPNYTHFIADLKALPFDDNHFDAISAISTIEHCGLPRYGDKIDKNGDILAIKEIVRVLKKGGYLILTVPYAANSSIYQNKHRVYNKRSFKKLIGKIKIIRQSFFAPVSDPRIFRPCREKQIEEFRSQNGSHGVICIVGLKTS